MSVNRNSSNRTEEILVVDDEVANLQLLTQLLSHAGYHVRPTREPHLAIESALAQQPDLILLNVRMPKIDGIEVCRRLRQDERTCDIPIIFVSAVTNLQDRIRGFEAGGVDFVSKPYQELEVLARVRTHLALRSMQVRLEEIVDERTAELSESEAGFRAIFEQAPVGIAHVSTDGHFLRLNQKFCDIVGYTPEEMRSKTFQEITHPDDLTEDLDLLQQLFHGEADSYNLEKRYIRKDSEVVWANLTVGVVRDSDHTPKWFISVVEDISERKQAEAAQKLVWDALQRSYDFMQHLTATVPDAIFSVKMPERTVQWCNDSYGVLGYDPQECVGLTTRKFYPSQVEADKIGALLEKAFSAGEEIMLTEVPLRRKNGEIFDGEMSIAVYRESGKVVSLIALVRDITERKKAETALQQSHDLLKHLISSIPDTVFSIKLPERVIEWAEDSYNTMGLAKTPESAAGQSTAKYFASIDGYNTLGEVQKKAIQEGKKYMRAEALGRREDGTIFPAEITGTFYREDGEVRKITAMVRDITERRQAEERIHAYQERLRAMASELIFAEERERQRIATELHDGAAQSLALARLQLAEAAEAVAGSSSEIILDEASQQVRRSLEQIRTVLLDLSSPTLHQMGLSAGLSEWLEAHVRDDYGLTTVFRDECPDVLLADEMRLLLFRNVCELLTNVVKHGQAQRACLSIARVGQELQIIVEDDGVGFDPGSVGNLPGSGGGFGLFSVAERMADLGGSLEIESAPGQGCKATLVAPLEPVGERGSQ
jgi:PAS domain S-box-containing protein